MQNKLIKLLTAFTFVLLIISCKKQDIFNYDLPTGRINGKIIYEVNGQPVKDITIIMQNTNSGAWHLVITDAEGKFTVGRLAAGKYSIVPTNDSLYSPSDITADVADGKVVNVPDIKIRLTDIPVLTLNASSVLTKTNKTILLKTLVNDGHSTVITRGYKYLKSSDPRDASLGSTKTHSISADPFDLTYYQSTISGLSPNTEYKIRSFVIIPRGGIANGVEQTMTVYSDSTLLVKTLP